MKAAFALAITLTLILLGGCSRNDEALIVYSARNEQLLRPILDRYTEETGVAVDFITDSAGPLIQRLAAEGENTPADLLITVDAGNLWQAAERGLLRPVDSATLRRNIPESLRDPKGRWYGISVRARTIAYNTGRVDPAELNTYAGLADARWKGRLCLRTSRKVYNQSLVAMLVAEHGEEETEEIVRGWVENLATDVFSSDTLVLEAIAAGQCDVGIVNSYYFGRLLRERPDLPLALYWPDQGEGERGVHVNVAGAGVTTHAPQPESAIAFLEWLSTPDAQALFAALNLEYPANPGIQSDPLVRSWGEFERNTINIALAGELQADAVMLMQRAGYQ